MLGIEVLHLVLDVAVAATLSAWLLAFATESGTARATAAMLVGSERVRVGALAVGMGFMVQVAALVVSLLGDRPAAHGLSLLAYPLLLGGAFALASATWRPEASAASEVSGR